MKILVKTACLLLVYGSLQCSEKDKVHICLSAAGTSHYNAMGCQKTVTNYYGSTKAAEPHVVNAILNNLSQQAKTLPPYSSKK